MRNHHDRPPDDLAILGMLCVSDLPEIDRCWMLDNHTDHTGRTVTGNLTYDAKQYGDKPGDRAAAERLAENLVWWYRQVTRTRSGDASISVVVPVPSLRQREPHNLPDVLARGLADAINARSKPDVLAVCRSVGEMKHLAPDQRPAALTGAFAATPVTGTVLLVDDLLQSGSTLSECARTLRAAGASNVVAACATRATKGLTRR